MGKVFFHLGSLAGYRAAVQRNALKNPGDRLSTSAIVFAPHQDDEVLGCGGTIIQKCRAGARVRIVFMCDGSRSHPGYMPEDELRARRMREANESASVLGVGPEDVTFLSFPETRLQEHAAPARQRVLALLRQARPGEVYVPYRSDVTPDHVATSRIVGEAIRESGLSPVVFEYPVWYWYHWPWVGLPVGPTGLLPHILMNSLASGFGLRTLREFRHGVFVGDVLDRKRAALECHATQMKRLVPDTDWPILSDVARGEFLQGFFQQFEVFHRHAPVAGRIE